MGRRSGPRDCSRGWLARSLHPRPLPPASLLISTLRLVYSAAFTHRPPFVSSLIAYPLRTMHPSFLIPRPLLLHPLSPPPQWHCRCRRTAVQLSTPPRRARRPPCGLCTLPHCIRSSHCHAHTAPSIPLLQPPRLHSPLRILPCVCSRSPRPHSPCFPFASRSLQLPCWMPSVSCTFTHLANITHSPHAIQHLCFGLMTLKKWKIGKKSRDRCMKGETDFERELG